MTFIGTSLEHGFLYCHVTIPEGHFLFKSQLRTNMVREATGCFHQYHLVTMNIYHVVQDGLTKSRTEALEEKVRMNGQVKQITIFPLVCGHFGDLVEVPEMFVHYVVVFHTFSKVRQPN